MKRITFALAAVMLPFFSYCYQEVPLGTKTLKISRNAIDARSQFMRIDIPPNALRVIYHISVSNTTFPKPIGLYRQVEDILTGPAVDYLVPYLVESKKSNAYIDFQIFEDRTCAWEFYNGRNECIPSEKHRRSRGGIYQMPWVPGNYGRYFICFDNSESETDCYVTAEAVAIVQ